jgi:hypothetical protein
MRKHIVTLVPAVVFALAACSEPGQDPMTPQFAKNPSNTVSYIGQGLYKDLDGSWFLNRELCGVANGADVDGPYLLWVLTATGATSATITFATGGVEDGVHAMTKTGNGTFKYVSAWLEPNSLTPNKVTATYTGNVKNSQLVISHGCRPFNTVAAWCSPGFWGHVDAAGFALIGVDPNVQTFNVNVFAPYATSDSTGFNGFTADPSLLTVLTTIGSTYKQNSADYTFPNSLGTLVGANAFNATGAYLTSLIPPNPFTGDVYGFDPSLVGVTEACPIDNHGDYKDTGVQ